MRDEKWRNEAEARRQEEGVTFWSLEDIEQMHNLVDEAKKEGWSVEDAVLRAWQVGYITAVQDQDGCETEQETG